MEKGWSVFGDLRATIQKIATFMNMSRPWGSAANHHVACRDQLGFLFLEFRQFLSQRCHDRIDCRVVIPKCLLLSRSAIAVRHGDNLQDRRWNPLKPIQSQWIIDRCELDSKSPE